MSDFDLEKLVTVLSDLSLSIDNMNENIVEVADKLDCIADQLTEIYGCVEHQNGLYNIDDVFSTLSSIEDDVATIKFNMD